MLANDSKKWIINIDHIHKIGAGCINHYLGVWAEVSLSLQNGFQNQYI